MSRLRLRLRNFIPVAFLFILKGDSVPESGEDFGENNVIHLKDIPMVALCYILKHWLSPIRLYFNDLYSEWEARILFESWCKEYDQTYTSEDEKLYRFGIFKKTLERITPTNQNCLFTNGYADRTDDELDLLTPGDESDKTDDDVLDFLLHVEGYEDDNPLSSPRLRPLNLRGNIHLPMSYLLWKRISLASDPQVKEDFGEYSVDHLKDIPMLALCYILKHWLCPIRSYFNPNGDHYSEWGARILFESWCKKYGKTYPSKDEKLCRFGIFKKNLEQITTDCKQMHAADSCWCSTGCFSDRTDDELEFILFPNGDNVSDSENELF
ncbi:hypothetical protein OROGR_016385 [Orobanche gracilis]